MAVSFGIFIYSEVELFRAKDYLIVLTVSLQRCIDQNKKMDRSEQ